MSWRALDLMIFTCVVVGSANVPKTMKAAVVTGVTWKEGDFSKVKVVDRDVPRPGRGQVLIKVAASSVNPVDFKILTKVSKETLLGNKKTLGFDVAGTIVETGTGTDRLKVGDEVWADLGKIELLHGIVQLGAWAEYAVADEEQVGLKPRTLSMVDAASLPLVTLTDLQTLQKAGAPWADKAGKNLTIVVTSGAGGTGVGLLQLVKAYGATRIITASSPDHFDLLKSLGATEVYDYHKTTIWQNLTNDSVDVVVDNLDAAGTADLAMPSIKPGGVFIWIPGKGGGAAKHPKEGVQQISYGLCNSAHHADLDTLREFVDAKQLKAVVEETHPLSDIVKALESIYAGHATGKIGITMGEAAGSTLVV